VRFSIILISLLEPIQRMDLLSTIPHLVAVLTGSYVSQSTAASSGLIWNWNGASYFGVNSWTVEPSGRPSVRLQSIDTYSEVLIIVDFAHVPGG